MLKIIHDEIRLMAEKVVSLTMLNAKKEESLDIPEFIAYEILDLSDFMAENHSVKDLVIKEILKNSDVLPRAKQIIKELS